MGVILGTWRHGVKLLACASKVSLACTDPSNVVRQREAAAHSIDIVLHVPSRTRQDRWTDFGAMPRMGPAFVRCLPGSCSVLPLSEVDEGIIHAVYGQRA